MFFSHSFTIRSFFFYILVKKKVTAAHIKRISASNILMVIEWSWAMEKDLKIGKDHSLYGGCPQELRTQWPQDLGRNKSSRNELHTLGGCPHPPFVTPQDGLLLQHQDKNGLREENQLFIDSVGTELPQYPRFYVGIPGRYFRMVLFHICVSVI